jgi:hypothetical protein
MTVGFRSAIVLATLFSIEIINGMQASADWEFTRWGMTPEQVIAASQGRAIADPAPRQRLPKWVAVECKIGLTSYRINEFRFWVHFCFDLRNLLAAIYLYAPESDFISLDRALHSNFGPPINQKDDGLWVERSWNDQMKYNSVRLFTLPPYGLSVIEYKALVRSF